MSDLSLSIQEPNKDPGYQEAIQQIHIEITRLNQKMDEDRIVINRLKTETELLKVETRAILADLGVAV